MRSFKIKPLAAIAFIVKAGLFLFQNCCSGFRVNQSQFASSELAASDPTNANGSPVVMDHFELVVAKAFRGDFFTVDVARKQTSENCQVVVSAHDGTAKLGKDFILSATSFFCEVQNR